jgi:voltage-gated potassium channel
MKKSESKKGKGINPTIKVLLFFIVFILSIAFCFSKLEGISFFDAIYWGVTTCSTVGYGDISPKTPYAKLLTMFLMISGVALLGYLLSTMSDKLMSLNMSKVMGLRKVKISEHVIIVGWNIVAKIALDELRNMGADVVLIDSNQHPEISAMTNTHFVLGSCQDGTTLKKAGIQTAKAIILVMESDSEVILAVSSIRKVNSSITIIGRIDDLDFAEVAKQAGCNRVVSPSETGGHMLFSALEEPAVVRWFEEATVMNYGVDIIDKKVTGTNFAGLTVGEVESVLQMKIIGIEKLSKNKFEALPEKTVRIEVTDTLILLYKETGADVMHFSKRLNVQKVLGGDVLLVGWNPTVRSAVNEFLFSKHFTISVLSNEVTISEKEHYEQAGVTFISKDISKLSLNRAFEMHGTNVIVGIDNDSEAILSSHIIKGLKADINLIVRVDDPANNDAAESIGANQIISPSVIGGRLLANAISNPASVTLLMEAATATSGMDTSQFTIDPGSKLDGARISDFTYEKRFLVVGLERANGGELVTLPSGEEQIHAGDTLIFLHV